MIHGPAGSGKTVLCKKICESFSLGAELKATAAAKVVWIDCQSFLNGDLEKSKKATRIAMSKALECQPTLVVIENVDIFKSTLGDGQASMETFQHCVFSEHLAYLMDCVRSDRHRVSFLATARSLDGVHKSLKRSCCFDTHFAMPVPSRKQKTEIFEKLAARKEISVDSEALLHLETHCDGLDVVDIESLVELSLLGCLGDITEQKKVGNRKLSVSASQMASTLKVYVPAKARGTSQVTKTNTKIKKWRDVKGMNRARDELEDLLSFSSKYKDLIEKCPLRLRTGALIYGPPGCGKTFLVK